MYPLADIRLLEYVISLPMLFFDTQEYDRALFRNICKGILPESVRLQQKYNGAMTLAFAEYSKKKAIEELKNYQIKNHLQLIDTNNLSKLDDFEKKMYISVLGIIILTLVFYVIHQKSKLILSFLIEFIIFD